ncbi:MAG TPA: HAMP domain-containing sensor histidine kinase [Solirubrobacteraceae bacterium]|nr:HAMP domain-containing sensor histidine kinase [Solirubrobacteraceae bacterium]
MSVLSLRARVAAAAAVAIVIAVGLLAVAVPALLERQLTGELDTSLRGRAAEVARLASSTPALLTEPGALEGRLTGGALFVQVVDRRARIVARSGALGGRLLPGGAVLRRALGEPRQAGYEDAVLGADPIRLYAAPLGELGGGSARGGAVLVAATTSGSDETLAHARRLVLLCALAAAALAALTATLLTRRALRPLARLSSGARRIERTGDVSERLPVPAAGDEVGELAATLNAMLASLERARESEQRFVADASHELRTPLTALRGNAAYVARHGADRAVLADIEADAARLAALLDDLLVLAREDAAEPAAARGEPVALADLARSAATGDGGTAVVIEPGAEQAAVQADPVALERALGNLVRNARTHGPADGAITITVGLSPAGERACLTVSDEGTGLSAEEARHAFERFWRGSDARAGGSGLGLAIVRATAERHGGSASADGARFTIELPAIRDLSESGRRTPAEDG